MKNNFILHTMTLGMAIGLLVSCSQSTSHEVQKATLLSKEPVPFSQEQVLRGEYMVTVMGCNDCHSPKVFGPEGPTPDPERLLSGHPQDMPLPKIDTTLIGPWVLFNPHNTATVGPWGVSFAANLTSDPTGIGNWTEEQFTRALREGKSKGLANNRNILPPMPWSMFSKLTDEDLTSIFAYLKSIKPVRNVPPPPMALKDISIEQ